MFCKNCGMQNEDGVLFCQSCGAYIEGGQQEATVSGVQHVQANNVQQGWAQPPVQEPKKKKTGLILGLVGLVVVVAMATALVPYLGVGSYKKTVDTFFEAYTKPDSEKMYSVVHPQAILEELDWDEEDYAELDEGYEDELEDVEILEYEIKTAEKMDDLDKLEDEAEEYFDIVNLDEFREYMEEYWYDDFDFDGDDIKEAYLVEVKVKAEVYGEKTTETFYDIVYKYQGKWYLAEGFGLLL